MKGILPRGDRAGGSAARAPLASPAAAIVSAPRATARTLRLRPQRPPCALRLAGPTRPFSQPEMRSACQPGIAALSLLTLECIILQRGANPGRGSQLMPGLSTLTPVRLETILQKIQLMRGIPVERDMSGKIGRSEKFRAGKELREAGNHRASRTRATIAAYWQASRHTGKQARECG